MVKFETRHKTLIVSVTGDIDQHSAAELRRQTDIRISHEDVQRLIFDFSAVDFMDSSGIGLVIGRYKLMSAIGGKVFVVTHVPGVVRLLEMSGVNKIIRICASLGDAMKFA